MGWSPAPLSITEVDVDKQGTTLSLIMQGASFAQGDDVFLIHSAATALELIASLTEGQKDAPAKGVIRATNVVLRNPNTLTCSASIAHAKKGAYKVVIDQVVGGLLEVAVSPQSIEL
jgi:hypothetical protein